MQIEFIIEYYKQTQTYVPKQTFYVFTETQTQNHHTHTQNHTQNHTQIPTNFHTHNSNKTQIHKKSLGIFIFYKYFNIEKYLKYPK
jgi:hypothetical protein